MKKLSIVDALGAESVIASEREARSVAINNKQSAQQPSLRDPNAVGVVAKSSAEQRRHKKTPLENPQVDCHDPLRGSRNDDSTSPTRNATIDNDDSTSPTRNATIDNDDSTSSTRNATIDNDDSTSPTRNATIGNDDSKARPAAVIASEREARSVAINNVTEGDILESRTDSTSGLPRGFATRNDDLSDDSQQPRQISPVATKNDESSDISLRPSSWDGYIGQDKIKKNLRVFIEAAKSRGECLDHILFFGPPGLGKTTLSYIIANAMGANIKVIAAPMIEKSGDLAALLTNLTAGDIFFIDEIHRMSPAIEEVLYPAMEDFRLDITIGSGPAAQTLKIDLPRFTLVGATTRAGMLSNPLRERFGISFNMSFYTHEELSLIIKNAAAKLGRNIEENAAQEIAKRSRGTPRIALRLLKRVRDFADVESKKDSKNGAINLEIAKFALGELGINDLGFDELDIRYLKILTAARRRPLGLNTIAAAMSEDEGTIEDVIEPYLLANGYMERTAKGRVATALAYEVVGEKFQKDSLF